MCFVHSLVSLVDSLWHFNSMLVIEVAGALSWYENVIFVTKSSNYVALPILFI